MSYFSQEIIRDVESHIADVTIASCLLTASPFRLVGVIFADSTLDTKFWTSTVSGAGASNTTSAGLNVTASGTANSGYGQLQSVRSARFVVTYPLLFHALLRIPTVVVAQNTRRWGAFTVSPAPTPFDGHYFELSPAGVLSVNCRNAGGTVDSVASGSFNGSVSSYVVDTNVHTYEIEYRTSSIWYFVDGVLLHIMRPTTVHLTSGIPLPITVNSVNSASGTTSGTIESWTLGIIRHAVPETAPASFFQSGTTAGMVLKRGPGNIHGIIISGVANNSDVTLYDNTAASGTVIWDSGAMSNQTVPFALNFKMVPFFIGLTLVIAAANSNVLVSYE